MRERFLPIGTICTLRGINKKIMISGYFGISYRGKLKMYDYTGVEYPEGLLLQNRTYSFNHTDIENIEFIGYESEEYTILNNNLLNNNVSSEAVEETKLMTNFKFDENGVVIFDGSVKTEEVAETKKSTSNPFNQIYMKQETKVEEKKGFEQFKFDENGVVIAEETESIGGFKFDENGIVIMDNYSEPQNQEESGFKFDENGVVISDNM
ncbi:MAG: DUF4176 domain-containing protein [Firmicutes bacterium]|nr:DUF4176 domain-containing protein [Bacillota bacterium]